MSVSGHTVFGNAGSGEFCRRSACERAHTGPCSQRRPQAAGDARSCGGATAGTAVRMQMSVHSDRKSQAGMHQSAGGVDRPSNGGCESGRDLVSFFALEGRQLQQVIAS